jgi:hypothetical protein
MVGRQCAQHLQPLIKVVIPTLNPDQSHHRVPSPFICPSFYLAQLLDGSEGDGSAPLLLVLKIHDPRVLILSPEIA